MPARKRAAVVSETEYRKNAYHSKKLLAIAMKTLETAKSKHDRTKIRRKNVKRFGSKHNPNIFSSLSSPNHLIDGIPITHSQPSPQSQQEIAQESEAPALQAELLPSTDNESEAEEESFSDVDDILGILDLDSVSEPPLQFREKLGLFVHKHSVTEACLRDLLLLLREEGHFSLPRDARTILSRSQVNFAIETGKMLYLGITHALEELKSLLGLRELPTDAPIELNFNCDGLPLSSKYFHYIFIFYIPCSMPISLFFEFGSISHRFFRRLLDWFHFASILPIYIDNFDFGSIRCFRCSILF